MDARDTLLDIACMAARLKELGYPDQIPSDGPADLTTYIWKSYGRSHL